MDLCDFIQYHAATRPQATALICAGRTYSYSELSALVRHYADRLRAHGVKHGDLLCFLSPNSADMLLYWLASVEVGALPMGINHRLGVAELSAIADGLQIKASVVDSAKLGGMQPAAGKFGGLIAINAGEEVPTLSSGALPALTLPAPAVRSGKQLILCTSGSTGKAKMILWNHETFLRGFFRESRSPNPMESPPDFQDIVKLAKMRDKRIIGVYSPLDHGAAQVWIANALMVGNAIFLHNRQQFSPEQVFADVERHRINVLNIVGDAMAVPMLDFLGHNPGRHDLSSISHVKSSGMKFSIDCQVRLSAAFKGAHIVEYIGASEMGTIALRPFNPVDLCFAPSFGVRIMGENGNLVHEPGQTGKIVKCTWIAEGYYGDSGPKGCFFEVNGERWASSSDNAQWNSYRVKIEFLGRDSDFINTGGEKVYASEIADCIRKMAGIKDVVVFGIAHEKWGQAVTALLIKDDTAAGIDEAAVRRHCVALIAKFKVPKYCVFLEQFPYLPNGKLDVVGSRRLAQEAVEGMQAKASA